MRPHPLHQRFLPTAVLTALAGLLVAGAACTTAQSPATTPAATPTAAVQATTSTPAASPAASPTARPPATAPARPASPAASPARANGATMTPSPNTARTASPAGSPASGATGTPTPAAARPNSSPSPAGPSPVGATPTVTAIPPRASPTSAAAATAPAKVTNRPVAFVQSGDVWLVESEPSAAPRRLTQRGDVREVAWAAGGRRLAFQAGTGNEAEIYNLDVASGQERRLTNNQVFDGQPDWSPDGRWLVFTRGNAAGLDEEMIGRAIVGDIWRMDADGGNARRLTAGRAPAWAPDGRRIAFVTNGDTVGSVGFRTGNELHLINAEGQNEWALLRLSALPQEIDLSGQGAIFGPGPELFDRPVWTGGGRAVAATVWGAIPLIISITDQAQNLTVVAASHEGGLEGLVSQPGGPLLAYTVLSPSGVPFVEIAPYTLVVSNQNGRVRIGGIRAGEVVAMPAWAPDGQSLAALVGAGDSGTIVRYLPSGREQARLVSGPIAALDWE